jgi:Rho-binding antiterminator
VIKSAIAANLHPMDKYIPVDCDFHDELEALATLRQTCRIVYRHASDELVAIEGRIVDIYAANQADFLKLNDGTEIRLDKIISVNSLAI